MPEKRVIVALDVDSQVKAAPLVDALAPHVYCFKIGLEFMSAVGLPQAVRFVQDHGGAVFTDAKLKDIPNTVTGAAREIARQGVKIFNVHCDGGSAVMRAARSAVDAVSKEWNDIGRVFRPPLILGVTLLTSLSYEDLVELRIAPNPPNDTHDAIEFYKRAWIEGYVSNCAALAKQCGLDGVIASPKEIMAVRGTCGKDFCIITPGVRPLWAEAGDQKRVKTPAEAITLGADYLVIGRPVTKPPAEIGSPLDAILKINAEIEEALAEKKGGD